MPSSQVVNKGVWFFDCVYVIFGHGEDVTVKAKKLPFFKARNVKNRCCGRVVGQEVAFFKAEAKIMETSHTIGGHKSIYEDLLKRLAHADIESSANKLDLGLNEVGEAKVPFCGVTYLVSRAGLRRADGQKFSSAAGSALIRYVLRGSRIQTIGQFVTLAMLAGPLFKQGSYSTSALERPIIKRFQGRTPELLTIASSFGGKQGGEAGLGSVSLIFDLLPHIPLQLIFYDRDEEFPARANLLFDSNATQVIDFETLAVLITLWVHDFTKP